MGADRTEHDELLQRLLETARAGDERGFTGIYRMLGGRVAGYLRSRGVADVDDVTNETFAGAFRNLHTFEGSAPQFRSWLFRIAWNKSADWHRLRPRQAEPVERERLDQRAATSTAESAMAVFDAQRIDELLGRLTEDQRTVIQLRVIADLSLQQTAAVVGKPVAAVKSLQHRALAALQREISRKAESFSDHSAITELR